MRSQSIIIDKLVISFRKRKNSARRAVEDVSKQDTPPDYLKSDTVKLGDGLGVLEHKQDHDLRVWVAS